MTRYHARYNDAGEKIYEVINDEVTINKQEQQNRASYHIVNDIQPYKSQVTGEVINSRSAHREYLKRNDLVEFGNEMPKARGIPEVAGRREAIIEACKKHKVRGF